MPARLTSLCSLLLLAAAGITAAEPPPSWAGRSPSGDDVRIDGHEIVDYRWMTPEGAIAEQLQMAPPTIVSLHELAEAGSFAATRRTEYPRWVTRPTKSSDDVPVLLWHGDAGYETLDAELPGPRNRLWYPADGPWT